MLCFKVALVLQIILSNVIKSVIPNQKSYAFPIFNRYPWDCVAGMTSERRQREKKGGFDYAQNICQE